MLPRDSRRIPREAFSRAHDPTGWEDIKHLLTRLIRTRHSKFNFLRDSSDLVILRTHFHVSRDIVVRLAYSLTEGTSGARRNEKGFLSTARACALLETSFAPTLIHGLHIALPFRASVAFSFRLVFHNHAQTARSLRCAGPRAILRQLIKSFRARLDPLITEANA